MTGFVGPKAFAQTDGQLTVKGATSMKVRAKGLGLNSGVKAVNWNDEDMEGVTIEVKKGGATISKTTSGKKGKYSVQIPVSSTDAKNDYVIYFSKAGMGTKMIFVNAYVPKAEYDKFKSDKWEVSVNAGLIPTTVPDAAADKPFAKIKWDISKEHTFVVDPTFERQAFSEEQKILANPDTYYSAIAKKSKKKEDALAAKNKAASDAKAKAEEEARKKAEEEANRLAAIKAKEDAERLEREKAEAAKRELRQKQIADSLALAAKRKAKESALAKNTDVPRSEEPVQEPVTTSTPTPDILADADILKNVYDGTTAYSINLAKKTLSELKAKRSAERAQNLTAKYETNNVLTSLLNEVEEFDRVLKKR